MQRSPRNGVVVDTFLVHHQASTNDDATIDLMVSGRKRVSANYTISNEGRLTLVVDEDYRAWTSGSTTDGGRGAAMDRRSITVEVENESGAPDWRISSAAMRTLAALYNDVRSRYRVVNLYGHRDLWTLFRASYPTYCPGPQTVSNLRELAGGTVVAAALPVYTPVAGPTAVNYHFGLTAAAMLAMQRALARLGRYAGDQDGDFAGQSVSEMQQWLKDFGYLAADYLVDGVPGTVYGLAIQTLGTKFGYTGDMDGRPAGQTSASMEAWAATIAPAVAQTSDFPAGSDWSYWEPSGEVAKSAQRAMIGIGRLSASYVVDGVLGPVYRAAMQVTLNFSGTFNLNQSNGKIDGLIERGGCYGMQQYAANYGDYPGPIDGAPREASWAGFILGLQRK